MNRLGSALLGVAALAAIGAAPADVLHAKGQFTVKVEPEAESTARQGERATGRLALTKSFTGDLTGVAHGTMVSVGGPRENFAAYVVLDQFVGKLGDRTGGFVMLHRGSMTGPTSMTMEVTVPNGSGSGALGNIEGTMTITIKGKDHYYDLAYRLRPTK